MSFMTDFVAHQFFPQFRAFCCQGAVVIGTPLSIALQRGLDSPTASAYTPLASQAPIQSKPKVLRIVYNFAPPIVSRSDTDWVANQRYSHLFR